MVKKSDCVGCYNDLYNRQNMGANMRTGKPECWSFESAKLISAKDVPINMPPPYNKIPLIKRPDCYYAQGYSRVKKEYLDCNGYWKSFSL